MHKKLFLSVTAAAAVSIFTACGGENNDNTAAENQNGSNIENQEQAAENGTNEINNTDAPQQPEPQLEDVPDVVAEVNEAEITKDEFETAYQGMFMQASQETQMTGEEVNQDELKEETAENLVRNELLVQEAENRDISVSEEEVEQTLEELAVQNGLESSEDLLAALEQQGTEEEEVMVEIEEQAKLDELIANEAGDIEVTDEEVEEMYEQMTAQQEQMAGNEGNGTELPALEEVRPEIENEIESQKQNEYAHDLVEDLREDADVTIHL
ncbi:SurA N-terminal domain-containing protein [Alkalicoccus daliensis]|uniref:peptidylprolyl isomerase n=1 Tax=Alkalicoccus daliensis TaxID=745820 RepID=A0A1H0E4S3_9BACI|nr:SurA N-terminal domain-containing protein [Alkalicoccus daliensis]SDN77346.1 peptidyl-prolyl cis-trans isomerase SurA [Alkalicoccus daliensis]